MNHADVLLARRLAASMRSRGILQIASVERSGVAGPRPRRDVRRGGAVEPGFLCAHVNCKENLV